MFQVLVFYPALWTNNSAGYSAFFLRLVLLIKFFRKLSFLMFLHFTYLFIYLSVFMYACSIACVNVRRQTGLFLTFHEGCKHLHQVVCHNWNFIYLWNQLNQTHWTVFSKFWILVFPKSWSSLILYTVHVIAQSKLSNSNNTV